MDFLLYAVCPRYPHNLAQQMELGAVRRMPPSERAPRRISSWRDAMRPQRILATAFGLLLAQGPAHAQTEEVQREVEAKLWIQRVFEKIEAVTGATPLVSVLTLLALALALVASIWLRQAWRKKAC
jgi:hypothetical protein